MEYIYSAMLLHKAGKKVDEGSVKKVLEAAGAKIEESRIKALVAALDGVDIDKAIKEASIPTVATAAVPVQVAEAKEEKKEEKKQDKASEEKAAAGLSALFG